MIFTTDPAGRGLYASPRLLEYIGPSLLDVSGSSWIDCVHLEDREIVRRLAIGAWRARCVVSLRFRLIGRDGGSMWVAVDALPSLGPSGRALNGFIAFATPLDPQSTAGLTAHGSLASFLPAPEQWTATPDFVLTRVADHLIAEHRRTTGRATDKVLPSIEAALFQVGYALAYLEKVGRGAHSLH